MRSIASRSAGKIEVASELASQLRSILGQMKRRLREHGTRDDLTHAQISVLVRLDAEGPATVSDLARSEGMRPQSMSAVVQPLLDNGLLTTAADPTDGRKVLVSLSRKCQTMLQQGRAARQDWLTKTIHAKLSAKEQGQLTAACALLARLVED